MELKTVKGLSPKTRASLQRAGIKTAETLAVIDVRRKRVPGVPPAHLLTLRKSAQRAVYQQTSLRLKALTRRAKRLAARTGRSVRREAKQVRRILRQTEASVRGEAHQVELLIRDATVSVLLAAKTAQERAQQARNAAQDRATTLAKVAAEHAKEATRSAEREYLRILKQFQKTPAAKRASAQRYVDKAKYARDAAVAARDRAVSAARWARAATVERGRSLLERVQGRVGGS